MTTHTFKDLLEGYTFTLNNGTEYFYVGSDHPNQESSLWGSSINNLFSRILPSDLFTKLRNISEQLRGKSQKHNLHKFTVPIPVSHNKYLSYLQFLTWTNLLQPTTQDVNDVVVGQLSIVVKKVSISTKKLKDDWKTYVYQQCIANKELFKMITDSISNPDSDYVNWSHGYVTKHCSDAWKNPKYWDVDRSPFDITPFHNPHTVCQRDITSKINKHANSVNPQIVLSTSGHNPIWDYIEYKLGSSLSFITLDMVSIDHSTKCWKKTKPEPEPVIIGRRIQCPADTGCQRDNYYQAQTNLKTILDLVLEGDGQQYLYKRWVDGCFKLNLEGLPQIEYDPHAPHPQFIVRKNPKAKAITQEGNKQNIHRAEQTFLYQYVINNYI